MKVKTDVPTKQRYRPRNPAMQAIINEEIHKMLQEGIIELSRSAWSLPIVIGSEKKKKKTESIASALIFAE